MELAGVSTPAAAFIAGLTTSLHCVGMCGPLACALSPMRGGAGEPVAIASVYQGSRVLSYGILGAVAGLIGAGPISAFGGMPATIATWFFVAFFLAIAFRLDKRLPRSARLSGIRFRIQRRISGGSPYRLAAALGFATPLLPCGPLYFIVTIAAFSGSPLIGAELMISFALGTLPLLWVAQANYGWIRQKLTPVTLSRLQTGVAIAATIVLAWRIRGTLGFPAEGIQNLICWTSS